MSGIEIHVLSVDEILVELAWFAFKAAAAIFAVGVVVGALVVLLVVLVALLAMRRRPPA